MEDDIDCSNFVINDEKPKRNLILDDAIDFENVIENNGIENLIEKMLFFQNSNVLLVKFLLEMDWKILTLLT